MPAIRIKWNGFSTNASTSCVIDVGDAGAVLSPPNVVGTRGSVRRDGKDSGAETGDSKTGAEGADAGEEAGKVPFAVGADTGEVAGKVGDCALGAFPDPDVGADGD